MRRIPAGLAACLVAAVAGCGTVHQGQGTATQSTAGGTRAAATATPSTATATPSATTGTSSATTGTPGAARGAPSACRNRAPMTGTLTITLASNQKTYCLRVGEKVIVFLRGTDSSRWLRPVASSAALTTAPNPAGMLARGVTGAAFAAVRPGQALVTSVRPPCRIAIRQGKDELEPADPLPAIYPLQFCPPGQRFSASLIVVR